MSKDPQNTMEGRARRRASPAGIRTRPARVEPEPPPTKRHELGATRVAVVYYLRRNHELEHPHFMEVPLASPQGLYLRDVLSRLDALRGKGMAAKYSWSCKRRYKTGFVWQDLSEGDLLVPAQGTEYVLKGSELQLDQPTADTVSDPEQNSTSTSSAKVQLPEPTRQESPPAAAVVSAMKEKVPPPAPQQILLSSASASTIGYDEQCRMPHSGSSSDPSPKTSRPSSGASSPGLNNPAAAHDVATQTDEKARGDNAKLQQRQDSSMASQERPELVNESHPKHRSGTLQSLIRAEAVGRRRSLTQEEDGRTAATGGSVGGRLKPASLLMCLMACKPRFTQLEFPLSPELKPGTASASTVRASETENSTGSLLGGAGAAGEVKASSWSRGHQDGVCEEACFWKGDPVNPSRSTSKRMSDENTPSDPNEHFSLYMRIYI